MSEQRHVIKRQVIDLEIQGDAQAQPLQDELSRVYRQRILPLIERHCSSLCGPDQVFRIDRLDLDLGELDLHSLEEDFVSRVDAALGRELAGQIAIQERAARQSGGSSRAESQLELFAFFVTSGCLPWWADASRAGLLAKNLENLLDEAPEALRQALPDLLRKPEARQRLANQYQDDPLIALTGLLVPNCAEALRRDFRDLLDGLRRARAASGGSGTRLRQVLWNGILWVSALDGQDHDTPQAFYEAVLQRVAFELDSPALLVDLRAGEIQPHTHLADILAQLPGPTPAEPVLPEKKSARLAMLQARGGPLLPAWAGLIALLPELPAARRSDLETAIDHFLNGASAQTSSQRVLQILQAERRENPGPKLEAVFQPFRTLAEAAIPTPLKPKSLDLSFSAADEYPVANAGLVILWPFLGHFFSHLGLLEEDRRFKDLASRQRAAGLLQVVAAQDAAPPEYLLPLNKLLCGLDVESVFEFGPDLLESEAQECENLLAAVITQAPILREMSADGFRGSFLLRAGVLSARDGMGLLRVERQTYDIVLERFPWSWEWVRLPWMEAPLRVEW